MEAAEHDQQVHIIFLPFMAPGHMLPMVAMARHLSSSGVRATIITTKQNALSLRPTIDLDAASGCPIRLLVLAFPSRQVGLPQGCENLTSLLNREDNIKFIHALDILKPEMEKLIRELQPDCIASDYMFTWTVDVAEDLGVPRLAFSGSGLFNLCVSDAIERFRPHENVRSESEPFVVSGLPHKVELTRPQLPDIVKTKTEFFSDLFRKLKEAESRSFGILMNSFYELEPGYADHFRRVTGCKVWPIGPISLFTDKEEEGRDAGSAGRRHDCLSWLDDKRPNSVIYVGFGSLTRISKAQIAEIANALEESGHCFIWGLREGMEDGKTKSGKGFVVGGWAPQRSILEHQATGGFMTHCGWNSILEGVSAGVPMVTWPLFADQFYNEKLVTQVLRIGVPVGNEVWRVWATDEADLVERDKIKRAVCNVMDVGNEAEEMRSRVRMMAESAKKAVRGGSSWKEMKILIEDIRKHKSCKYFKKSKSCFRKTGYPLDPMGREVLLEEVIQTRQEAADI